MVGTSGLKSMWDWVMSQACHLPILGDLLRPCLRRFLHGTHVEVRQHQIQCFVFMFFPRLINGRCPLIILNVHLGPVRQQIFNKLYVPVWSCLEEVEQKTHFVKISCMANSHTLLVITSLDLDESQKSIFLCKKHGFPPFHKSRLY